MTRLRILGLRPVSLVALTAMLWHKPATAIIVYKGQIVPAWPDITGPALAPTPGGNLSYALGTGVFPHPTGTVKGLVLLVDFSDQPADFTEQEISDWLNLEGFSRFGCNGSVHDYYYDISNGVVDLQHTVRAYYRAKNTKAYYEADTGYARADELLKEVIAAADPDVNFADYDNDEDGETESISILYAGPMVTWGQGLWPHAGWLGQKHDGVTVNRYQMANIGDSFSLYVFSHETGHMLFGWPDLYGFGDYCLMGNYMDATNPVPVNDFFRADQGWIPLSDITAETNATFAAAVDAGGYRYVNPAKPRELFFWSNVQNTGRWSNLAGSGLLMLHYDGSIDGNNPPDPLELAVVQADGKKTLDQTTWPDPGSDAKDFFRADNNAEFSSTTSPKSSWNDGSASGLRVYAISATGAEMQFSVGDGSAGGSPSTGGSSNTGGGAGTGGASASGGTATSGGREATGGRGRAGDSSTGGQNTAGGTRAGGTSSGGSPTGGSATGGVSVGGTTGNGGALTGGAANTGGAVATGGQGSGGSPVTASGGTNLGAAAGVSGTQAGGGGTGGLGTGAWANSQGGAFNATGGGSTANGATATGVNAQRSSADDGGCSCSVPYRSPRPVMDLLFSLAGLAGILRLASRRRRTTGSTPTGVS
ncbi:MAG: M6 family metalloprotease domain-containing protein [Polyangiaceae bacterium]|nr:M6 family metalloprotease domain-containing protein [Polyangiaceae bacterium]